MQEAERQLNHLNLDTNSSDATLIARVLDGDKDAYEMIIRKYNDRLFKIARSVVKDHDEAEDVLQEAYIAAYQQLPRFRKQSQFSTWLTRIVINEALARIRRRQKCVPVNPHTSDNKSLSRQDWNSSNVRTPEEETINSELRHILEAAIERLPEKYRTVYIMRDIVGMSVAETGQCLHISMTNVKVRLNRAKEMLRANLGVFYDDVEIYEFHLDRCDRIAGNVLRRLAPY